MRRAEIGMAVVLGLFSLYLMYMSQLPPLQIGWVPKKGPGAGAFPFWLSLGMLLCCIAIVIRGLQGKTPQSRSTDVFMDRQTMVNVGITVASIFMMLLLTDIISAYFAMFLFLAFYMGYVGKHKLWTTLAVSLLFPTAVFFLFESGMKILLPKGYAEPLFIPLYKMFVY
jgi:putative tricarboxylic transport membrane protein